MITSREQIVSIFAVSVLLQCSSATPQYFQDRSFNPLYEKNEGNIMNLGDGGVPNNIYVTHPNYNYQENDFLSDGWFDVNALPNEDSTNSYWSPEVSDALTPPVYEETKFNVVASESENQPLSAQNDFSNQFQRGRSDIEPDEDEEEFGGYFYPKPKVPFDLPDFKPVSAASDEGASSVENVTVALTSNNEESVEKTTTALTVEPNKGPSGKV